MVIEAVVDETKYGNDDNNAYTIEKQGKYCLLMGQYLAERHIIKSVMGDLFLPDIIMLTANLLNE